MVDASEPHGALGRWRRSIALFTDGAQQPRDRRTSDVVTLVVSSVVLVLLGWLSDPPFGFSTAVEDFFASFPPALASLWLLIVDLFSLAAVALIVTVFATKRFHLGRDLLCAAGLAMGGWLIGARIVTGAWPEVWDSLRSAGPPPVWASPRVAVPLAVMIVAKPHLTRPFRRLVNVLVVLAVFATAAVAESTPIGVLAGLLIGSIAAAIVHLVFGTSAGRPSVVDVGRTLEQLGIQTTSLNIAAHQDAGLFALDGSDTAGEPIYVKVYGRDARDSQWLATVWRTIWYRDTGPSPQLTRRQQVEHEALLTLLASQTGIVTDQVVTATQTPDEDAILVLRGRGRLLAHVAPEDVVDADELWKMLVALHRIDLAHGAIDMHTLVVDGARSGLVDFRRGSVGVNEDQQWRDRAQLLVTSALQFGIEPAVAAAARALGTERLAGVVGYLQPPALTSALRAEVKADHIDLDELRKRCAEAALVETPELVQLRRVTIGSLVRIVLPLVALFMLMSQFADIDFDELMDSLREATWWLIVVGFFLGQTPRLAQAFSTLGASPIPLPYGPVYALQLAVSYINLAIPSTAARVAVNIRFFQRRGLAPGSAIAIGALDGISGFIVQVSILLSILLLTPASLDLSFGTSSSGGDDGISFIALVIALAVISIVVAMIVPKWRRRILGFAVGTVRDIWTALRGMRSPRRLGLLFGGNLVSELLFATTLGVMVLAFGYHVGIVDLLFINVVVSMFAGLLPIPGGIGVVEGGLIYGLTELGIPEEPAFGAVMVYRLATFYLPPIWGYFSFRWLEKTKQL